jgi:hypothetical protein
LTPTEAIEKQTASLRRNGVDRVLHGDRATLTAPAHWIARESSGAHLLLAVRISRWLIRGDSGISAGQRGWVRLTSMIYFLLTLITRHRSHLDPTSTSRMYSIVYTCHDGSRNEGAEDKNLVIFCQDMPNERRRAFAYQTSIRFNRCNGATFHKIFASDTVARSPRWHPTPREQVLMTTLELVGFTPSCSDYWRKDFNLSEPP